MTDKGLLVVLSGPSGAGKGTVMKALLKRNSNIRLSVSATTRAPRPGEENGREYHFLSREEFLRLSNSGGMLESACYCGNFYGTPTAPIARWTSEGRDVFLEIEVQGGAQVERKRPDTVSIFILPPSLKELEHRLRGRGTEAEETVRKRLATARKELTAAEKYDYVVVNDSVDRAAEQICGILNAEKCRSFRNKRKIERMLEDD